MTTLSQELPRSRRGRLELRELWASLAIAVMWLAVLFDSVFGPDMRFVANDGNSSTIPSGVAVALFALLATVAIARRAFGRRTD